MYLQEQVDKLREEAEKFVIDNDRSQYWPYFKFMEQHAAANDFVFAGRCAIRLALGLPYDYATSIYEFYIKQAWPTAKALAVALSGVKSNLLDSRMIVLETNIPHREFTISLMGRAIVKLYSIDIRQGVDAIELLKPKKTKGYLTDSQIYVANEEMLLIDIYRTLHSPSKNAMWDEQFKYEAELFAKVEANIKVIGDAIKQARGGYEVNSGGHEARSGGYARVAGDTRILDDIYGAFENDEPDDKYDLLVSKCIVEDHCDDDRIGGDDDNRIGGSENIRYEVNAHLLKNLITDKYICIGEVAVWAYQQLAAGRATDIADNAALDKQRMQFISEHSADEVLGQVRALLKAYPQYGVKYVKYHTDLPNDFQTVKYIFYLTQDDHQHPVFDLYNNIQFEIVPYIQCTGDMSNVRIGNIFTMLRFRLINLWMLRIAYLSVKNNSSIANNIINIIKDVQKLRAMMKNSKLQDLFQLDNYAGRFIAENVARKKILTRFMQRFMPAIADQAS